MFSLAQIANAAGPFQKVKDNPAAFSLVNNIVRVIVTPLITALFFLTLLIFVWGVFGMITHGDDPTARKLGQSHIIWGIVGMAIMVSVYGIIRVIGSTVGVDDPFL